MKFRSVSLALLLSISFLAFAAEKPAPPTPDESVRILPEPDLKQSEADFTKNALDATLILYRQDSHGVMAPACTATSILKVKSGYVFLTAGHCVSAHYVYYLSDDKVDPQTYYQVDDVMCGNVAAGYDFCLLHTSTKVDFPVVPLGAGVEDATDPEEARVEAIASPVGFGKQIFRGYVTTPHIKRPVIVREDTKDAKDSGDVVGDWSDYMVLQMTGTNPGSSGASVLCVKQRAVCGIIIGLFSTGSGNETFVMPINSIVRGIEMKGLAYRKGDEPKQDASTAPVTDIQLPVVAKNKK